MITKQEIEDCKAYCLQEGYKVNEFDIAYLLLNREFQDKYLSYNIVKGNNASTTVIEAYDTSKAMSCLRKYMNANWAKKGRDSSDIGLKSAVPPTSESISFEENRQALIQMLTDVQRLMDNRMLDPKDGMKMMADIRIKLNDKFNVKETQVEQRIIVQPKFNNICEHTHKECWLQTKEYAMEHWHLIDDPKYKEEGEDEEVNPKKKKNNNK